MRAGYDRPTHLSSDLLGRSFSNMPKHHREIYQSSQLLLAELAHLGHHVSQTAGHLELQAHQHTNCYEICLIVRGEVDWWAGNDLHHVRAGQIYITQPNETHGGVDDVLQPCELYWLQVRLQGSRSLQGVTPCEKQQISDRFASLQRRRFNASPHLTPLFETLVREHRQPAGLAPTAARAALHQLLVTVLRDHDQASQNQPDRVEGVSPRIRRALLWLHTQLTQEVTIEQAAQVAQLSVTQFHLRFREEVGLTPHDWRLRQRMALARQRLRDSNDSVTVIAHDLGFATSQYFATTFKRLTGLTPTTYRQTHHPNKHPEAHSFQPWASSNQ